MNRLQSFPLLLLLFSFSSCIEFEREKLTYIHDEEKDEIRMTLCYEGIFGNLKKSGQFASYQKTTEDKATPEKLNQLQIEQIESVLKEKQAFFFSNWIFEYNQNTLKEVLKNEEEELTTEGKVFGKHEKELIKSLLAEIEIENIGFYLDAKGRLCGAQTLRLSNASKVITMANKVLGRQLKARLPEMKDFSPETITLIRKKLKNDFPFIRLQGNLLHLSMIMNRADQVKFSENSLTQLPDGIRIEFSDEILSLKCGGIDDEKGTLSRECFNGYQTNALNYVREQHSDLLLTKKEVGHHFRTFLSGVK
ncbi:MAG: hypothetical protein VX467_02955 [Verrucomicrobiota bacterium]|nr:hypothetical protein [Verrucomicrobiota bacterium]